MDLKPEHVASKKKIGKLKGKPVFEIATTGGWHIIVAPKMGKFETLGVGSHSAVARFVAKKREADIEYTELSKGDYMEPELFADLVPKYEALTERMRALNGD